VQFLCVVIGFLIQQPLILFNDFTPEIGHSHLPAHHSLKISVKLFCLPKIHYIVNGLGGQVVFDSFSLVFFALNLCLFMPRFQFSLAFEET